MPSASEYEYMPTSNLNDTQDFAHEPTYSDQLTGAASTHQTQEPLLSADP
jgi:hypothetical protein